MTTVSVADALQVAIEQQQAGRLDDAEHIYRQILALVPDHPDAHHLLGLAQHQRGQTELALASLRRAILLHPGAAMFHNSLGNVLLGAGRREDAILAFRHAIAADPNAAEGHNNLGVLLRDAGRWAESEAALRRALTLRPDYPFALNNLGNTLKDLRRHEEALACYRRALALRPDYPEVLHNLGAVLQELARSGEALDHFQRALALRPDFPEAYDSMGNTLHSLGRYEEAIASYRAALRLRPDYAEAENHLGVVLKDSVQIDAALASYRRALEHKPDLIEAVDNIATALRVDGRVAEAADWYRRALAICPRDSVRVKLATLLPPLYASSDEIAALRRSFEENLDRLEGDVQLADPAQDIGATNFFLAYQGENDRDLQMRIARFYAKACPALLYTAPHCLAASPPSPTGEGRRLRIGFVSRFFKNHTIGKLMRGLLVNLGRERSEVFVFCQAHVPDEISRFIADHVEHSETLAPSLAAAREQLAAHRLDVLFYADIGMDPFTYFLAYARLAPLQCTTWGHPVTTGLPHIDEFISSQLLEPEGAEAHYSERLVKLASLPVFYDRPVLPSPGKSRGDFGLPPEGEAHLYFCPHSLFKFHPDFDPVLAGVLRADPRGRVLLLRVGCAHWSEMFVERFRKLAPDVADRVLFLPPQNGADYLSLVMLSDVVLDTLHFGGGNTAFEALAAGTPIVTWPGRYMRGRVTDACYRKMGVRECSVASQAEYIALAVRLGTDAAHRAEVRSRILATSGILYEDLGAVREIERHLHARFAT